MRYFTYSTQSSYPICFLVPTIRGEEIRKEYLDPCGVPTDDVLVMDLHYSQTSKKTPAAEMKEYIESELVPVLHDQKVQYLVVGDADYFKVFTKQQKAEVHLGYVLDCVYGPWKVVYVPSYRSVFYNPEMVRAKIKQGIDALVAHATQSYQDPGQDIIHYAAYPRTVGDIQQWLSKLLSMDCDLTCDIEAFSLKHYNAGIGTITFCWNQHEGIAFPVDYEEIPGATEAPFGRQVHNTEVRNLLRDFFRSYVKRMIYHNISYDGYVLIYQLFMHGLLDTEGMLDGMETLLHNWEDTKLITYLATNSCAGNRLSLKDQAQEFAGNYAQDEIEDITRIPLPDLLRYNLVDGLSTWYVYNKHWQTMIDDNQEEIYQGLFKSSTVDIIQMQLTGLPMDMAQVKKVKHILEVIAGAAVNTMRNTRLVQEYEYHRLESYTNTMNAKWKKKRLTIQEMADAAAVNEKVAESVTFNPNSGPQLQELLYTRLALPVINLTKNKEPSTNKDTLEALINHAQSEEVTDFLKAMLEYNAVNKILTAFIPAMEAAPEAEDGWHYLCGYFNLGGTLSGRLSSSDPNLQNLPANIFMVISDLVKQMFGDQLDPYIVKGKLSLGKLIKSCFSAPPGWLFCGLDFASLEDRISALTTKDPEKLKVYQGHIVYELTINGACHHIRDDATVVYDGVSYTGEEFYERYGPTG